MENKFATKLRTMGKKLQSQIDDKLAERQENTPKRQCQAGTARNEGYRLKRTQEAMYALAGAYELNEVPAILTLIKTKKQIYELMRAKMEGANGGYYSVPTDTGEPALDDPAALRLWAMIDGQTQEEKEAEELHRKIKSLQFSNIPGYYPTPDTVIDMMIEKAGIEDHHEVLEPSAGSGAIMDKVKPLCKEVVGIEIHHTLREILKAKKHILAEDDFMQVQNVGHYYDRILMNPPFEKLQDAEHVMRAYNDFLREDGVLVAIMSPGPFFRSDKKSKAFQQWFDMVGGEAEDLPENSFKESGTGVHSKIVTLTK